MTVQSLNPRIVLAVLNLVARLPLRMLYVFSDAICFLIQHVFRYRELVILGNLRRAFPEKSETEIRQIASRYYRHLCDCVVETIKLLHVTDQQLRQRITVEGGQLIEELAADGRPIVVFLGHYGNWEWGQEVTRHYRRPTLNAEIYRPIKDKVMDTVMLRIRSRFSACLIPQKHAIRQLLRMHREGRQFIVAFIADQRPNSKNLYHWTTFLHQDTAIAVGGEELGTHVRAHFVYLDVEKPCRGCYRLTFKPIVLDGNPTVAYPYTVKFMQLMEETIRRAPEYWLWSHNRWEFDREGNTIHEK